MDKLFTIRFYLLPSLFNSFPVENQVKKLDMLSYPMPESGCAFIAISDNSFRSHLTVLLRFWKNQNGSIGVQYSERKKSRKVGRSYRIVSLISVLPIHLDLFL